MASLRSQLSLKISSHEDEKSASVPTLSSKRLPSTITSKPGPRSSPPSSQATADRKWWLVLTLALLTTAYAVIFLLGKGPSNPAVQRRMLDQSYGLAHIIGGLIAMLTGPFQFLKGFRQRNPKAHRIIGRVYAVSVWASSITGVQVAFDTDAYTIGQVGFAILALLWLVSCSMGMWSIWQSNIERHREWMTRNYALTYAAVMLRWQLPLYLFLDMGMLRALTLASFSCWVPNFIFAEAWIKYRSKSVPNGAVRLL